MQTIRTDDGGIDGYVLVTTEGRGSGLLSRAGRTIDMVIDEHLARAEHANRYIPDSELSAAHHAAMAAYDAGLTRIDELPRRAALDAETADYAEYLLIALRRYKITGPARTLLARNDSLLSARDPGRRYTQPCPCCEQPASYDQRYPRLVCDRCRARTTDRAGRRVTGYNVDFYGGMIAYYTDESSSSQREECVEVTRSGVCFIDGRRATMREGRFGGIVVESATE
ncbi:hypothetical protein [Nocardia neocaledoniensis]|uniref:hypothetical protein n=1 Tax=Nocardia neocaledoniensis TaxID=236511 RepID=UPI0024550BF4|nr:hypothetical protein [Nocardia neocaledoniensis]